MCDSDSKFNTIKQMPKTSKTGSETDKVMSASYHGGDQTNLIALRQSINHEDLEDDLTSENVRDAGA